jgi:hypothetical protein
VTPPPPSLQDTPNSQQGLYLDIRMPWPAGTAQLAQLKRQLAAHPGRSLAVTIVAPMTPLVTWLQSPDAVDFTSGPISWTCAPLAHLAHTCHGTSTQTCSIASVPSAQMKIAAIEGSGRWPYALCPSEGSDCRLIVRLQSADVRCWLNVDFSEWCIRQGVAQEGLEPPVCSKHQFRQLQLQAG